MNARYLSLLLDTYGNFLVRFRYALWHTTKKKKFILENPINQFQHSKSKSRQKKHLDADGTYTRGTGIHLY